MPFILDAVLCVYPYVTLVVLVPQSQSELSQYQKQYELLESHSKQFTHTTESRVKDLELVIETRDKALRETGECIATIEALKEAHAQEVSPLLGHVCKLRVYKLNQLVCHRFKAYKLSIVSCRFRAYKSETNRFRA